MITTILVRHGETTWNADLRFQGHSDSPLSERGIAQARAVTERLSSLKIDAIYSSDLARAVETIRPLAERKHLKISTTDALREKGYGEWEGRRREELEQTYPEIWRRYYVQRDIHTPIPGGEIWPGVAARTVGFLKQTVRNHRPGETILLVGHGGSLRPIVLHALKAPLESLIHLSLDNAGLTTLTFTSPDVGRVVTLNDVCHLEGLL